MTNDSFEVHIRGSTGTPYVAKFSRTGDTLHTTCSCQAGVKKTHCKHRLQLLGGDISSVLEPIADNLENRLSAILQGTLVQSAIQAVAAADADAKAAADRLKHAKKHLDRVMHQ